MADNNQSNNEQETYNPYGLDFAEVSEEDIIKNSIESGIAVFLHGKSSDGKSARVKKIDPNLQIIYLRNATPESLNGKSVYNSAEGRMIDIKPTWLVKLEKICEEEPDKNHVVFFDEISNALPSIQGSAFNIVLDGEVNGKWKLPKNARIVAAGNEVKDSLAANKIAEPLFNRFAHVYIVTTVPGWLKWASENGIHPAIYDFIACYGEKVLRSDYDGVTPNADPRKWEMASKILYQTNNPSLLAALVGEDICKKFVEFCELDVITLEDVLSGEYILGSKKPGNVVIYASLMNLSLVDEEHFELVRNLVEELGEEYLDVFDTMWLNNTENNRYLREDILRNIKNKGMKIN